MKPSCHALAVALALAVTAAFANPLASPTSITQDSVDWPSPIAAGTGADHRVGNTAQLSFERGRGPAGCSARTRSAASLYLADSDGLQLLLLGFRQAGMIRRTS